jgi:hypothetical protein
MAEAGKSLDEIAPFLRETVKTMGNVLEISFVMTCERPHP